MRVGIQYWTWFDYTNPGSGEDGNGWKHRPDPNGPELRPFRFPVDQVVRSHMIDNSSAGVCYSSMRPATAERHAHWMRNLGADFVIFDCTNASKWSDPRDNGIYQASKKAIEGFRANRQASIKVTYQLSLTCWRVQCHPNVSAPADRELYTWNSHVQKHVDDIYSAYLAHPDAFERVPTDRNKPLLLFYCSAGNNVFAPSTPSTPYWPYNTDLNDHFPRWPNFNERMSNGQLVRDVFSVRFALHCSGRQDFSRAPEIWPFQCDTEGTVFNETGYAALRVGDRPRSIAAFNRMVSAASGKPYLILRGFNEFSTTDENYQNARVYTMEVNNRLHHHDEQNGDPWWHWNRMRTTLTSARQ